MLLRSLRKDKRNAKIGKRHRVREPHTVVGDQERVPVRGHGLSINLEDDGFALASGADAASRLGIRREVHVVSAHRTQTAARLNLAPLLARRAVEQARGWLLWCQRHGEHTGDAVSLIGPQPPIPERVAFFVVGGNDFLERLHRKLWVSRLHGAHELGGVDVTRWVERHPNLFGTVTQHVA